MEGWFCPTFTTVAKFWWPVGICHRSPPVTGDPGTFGPASPSSTRSCCCRRSPRRSSWRSCDGWCKAGRWAASHWHKKNTKTIVILLFNPFKNKWEKRRINENHEESKTLSQVFWVFQCYVFSRCIRDMLSLATNENSAGHHRGGSYWLTAAAPFCPQHWQKWRDLHDKYYQIYQSRPCKWLEHSATSQGNLAWLLVGRNKRVSLADWISTKRWTCREGLWWRCVLFDRRWALSQLSVY